MKSTSYDRRGFLKNVGRWTLAAIATFLGRKVWASQGALLGYPRRPLEGACLEAGTYTERLLAALLDTVVPGPGTDPDGAPGALEACGMNLMLDDAYPFRGYANLMASLIDKTARQKHGAPFIELSYPQRLEVLQKAEELLPLLRLAFRAIRSAFYGGAYNGLGLDYLHFPGPNLGYRHRPDFSFRRAVCREMSQTGWLP